MHNSDKDSYATQSNLLHKDVRALDPGSFIGQLKGLSFFSKRQGIDRRLFSLDYRIYLPKSILFAFSTNKQRYSFVLIKSIISGHLILRINFNLQRLRTPPKLSAPEPLLNRNCEKV